MPWNGVGPRRAPSTSATSAVRRPPPASASGQGCCSAARTPQFLTATDAARLVAETPLRLVVDLRFADESAAEGHGALGRDRRAPRQHPGRRARVARASSSPCFAGAQDLLGEHYVTYAQHSPQAFVAVYRALAEPDGLPALLHCAAGQGPHRRDGRRPALGAGRARRRDRRRLRAHHRAHATRHAPAAGPGHLRRRDRRAGPRRRAGASRGRRPCSASWPGWRPSTARPAAGSSTPVSSPKPWTNWRNDSSSAPPPDPDPRAPYAPRTRGTHAIRRQDPVRDRRGLGPGRRHRPPLHRRGRPRRRRRPRPRQGRGGRRRSRRRHRARAGRRRRAGGREGRRRRRRSTSAASTACSTPPGTPSSARSSSGRSSAGSG